MALYNFTNVFEGNASDTIAINSDYVVAVYETLYPNPDTNELDAVTNIFTSNSITYQVRENYLTVIATLNSNN
jgi:hypothetical protein